MNKKYLMLFVIVPFIANLAFAQTDMNRTNSPDARIPEGIALILAGRFEMGIAEEDLKHLVEMGRKVPHMSASHAYWWFGDEIPRHTVEIDSFYMDACEVTNRQFRQFVQKTGYKTQGNWQKYAAEDRMNHPVVNVTWNDATAYAEWTGKRLPTEAEWEYAAKGNKDVKWFPWGDTPDATCANYRYQGESFFAGIVRLLGLRKINTKPVESYKPNGFGLYDVCGNVSEWCEDTHKPYPGGPQEDWIYTRYGPFKKNQKPVYGKVTRGGNWESPNPVFIRISGRDGFAPDYFSKQLGFRCAKSIKK